MSGLAIWLIWAVMLVGVILILWKFRSDNDELWKNFDRSFLDLAVRRTIALSWLIALLLVPGVTIGWASHKLLDVSVGKLANIPPGDLDQYFVNVPEPHYIPLNKYLAWKFDPWRLVFSKIDVALGKSPDVNEIPKDISEVALYAHHLLKFVWWLFIAYACYVGVRLYLYVFARAFVGRGGRVVMQLERSP
jgi:hypothetical protein